MRMALSTQGFDLMADNIRGNSGRDVAGRFAKGNPGRPIGVKNKTPRAVLAQVRAMEEGALQKLWQAVCNGEQWAISYVLSKLLPANRSIEFEDFSVADVKEALTHGDISPDEGKSLVSVLKNIREIESLEEIKERLEELEMAVKG